MAAIHGHCPVCASVPPTMRPEEYSCWPQSFGSTKLPEIGSSSLSGMLDSLGIVKTGTSGRLVVVIGLSKRLWDVVTYCGGLEVIIEDIWNWYCKRNSYLVVSFNGLCVVRIVLPAIGQHTPGTKRLLKQRDSRKLFKSNRSPGQLLRSSHLPSLPSGVRHLFSPSLYWSS